MKLSGVKDLAMDHKKATALIAVVVLVAIYGVFSLTRTAQSTTGQSFAEAEAVKGTIEVTVTGTGTILPVESEAIGPNTTGTVEKVYVQNGEKVKKGDLLLEVSNDSLKLQLENARLELEKADLELGDSSGVMMAPFAGRVVNLEAKVGDDVTKNSLLATLQNDSQLVFDMPVSGAVASKVVVNQTVNVFLPDRGEDLRGTVVSKNSQPVAGYNGENRVYLKVAVAATGNLSPGMQAFGTVTVDGKAVDALAVSSLEWAEQTQLKATSSGKITALYIREGQAVKKGQKLFAFDNSEAKGKELAYRQAELNVVDLEAQVADLAVTAPIDGVVSGLEVKTGDELGSTSLSSGKSDQSLGSSDSALSASTGSLGKIINSGQMEISFPVDEVEIAKIKEGQSANVTVDALPEETFTGKVTEIAEEGTVTNNVSSFEVTIRLDNKKNLLKSGMTANVTITAAKKKEVVLIPIEALQERGERKFVIMPLASADEGSGQAAEGPGNQRMQPVTVGLTNESFAEIKEGLKPGDKVLLPGQLLNNSRSMMPFGGGGSRNPMGGGSRSSEGGNRSSGGSNSSGGSGARN